MSSLAHEFPKIDDSCDWIASPIGGSCRRRRSASRPPGNCVQTNCIYRLILPSPRHEQCGQSLTAAANEPCSRNIARMGKFLAWDRGARWFGCRQREDASPRRSPTKGHPVSPNSPRMEHL